METNLSANKKTERSINHAFASHFAKSMFLTVLGCYFYSVYRNENVYTY